MEVKGNFLTQPKKNFPLDCETLDNLQRAIATVEMFGNLLGDKIILSGCTKQVDGTYAEGYVFIKSQAYPNGEVIPFKGGNTAQGVKIVTEDISVNTPTTVFASAYTVRYLAPADGSETGDIYAWDEFANVTPLRNYINNTDIKIKELEKKVSEHIGVIKMWAGTVDQIPEDYLLCDGRKVSGLGRDSFAALRAVLGAALDEHNMFAVPDLRGRFIVGYNNEDEDYAAIGKTGGQKEVLVSWDNIPKHSHPYSAMSGSNMVTIGTGTSASQSVLKGLSSETRDTEPYGSEPVKAIDNRPPYYVLAYIIKAK